MISPESKNISNIKSLNNSIKYAMNTKFYKEKFKGKNTQIKSLEDFKKLPFTTPLEVKNMDNFYDRIAIHESKIFTMVSSTNNGIWALSKKDYYLKSQNFCENYNIPKGNCISLIPGFGWTSISSFINSLRNHISVINLPPSQINKLLVPMINKLKIKGIIALPSTIINIALILQSKNIDPKNFKLEYIIFCGETYSNFSLEFIKKTYNTKVFEVYGAADVFMIGFGKAGDMKLLDTNYIEVVENEFVITTLVKEAMPLIRYKIGDIIKLDESNKNYKIIHVLGRDSEGINTKLGYKYPKEIEEIIYKINGSPTNYLINIIDNQKIEIIIESEKKYEERITKKIICMGINPKISIVKKGTLPEIRGKAKRIIHKKIL